MSDDTPSDDAALMRRVQAGDEAALGALMERWELPLKSLVLLGITFVSAEQWVRRRLRKALGQQ